MWPAGRTLCTTDVESWRIISAQETTHAHNTTTHNIHMSNTHTTTHNYTQPVFELSKRRWGGRNFSLGGGLRDKVGGSKFFFDTGLKKRWGVENYTINQVYGVRNRFKGAHTVCHSNI